METMQPVPERKHQTTWKTFFKTHWDVLAAVDFTTIEVWTKGGLVTYYLLFVMELKTRRVHFAGCTTNPDASRSFPAFLTTARLQSQIPAFRR